MKTLSDYKNEEAIELWGDLLNPITEIITDKDFIKNIRNKQPIVIAKSLIEYHSKEVVQILLRIDPTPINGINLLARLLELLNDIGNYEEVSVFFGSAPKAKEESESSGSVTENTEDGEK